MGCQTDEEATTLTTAAPETVLIDGEEYYQVKAVLRVPKNWTPESGVLIAVAPPGGIANFPYAIKGDNGLSPVFRNVNLVELEPGVGDASAEWTLITPATETVGPVYDLELTLHKGEAGADGTLTILNATDLDETGAQAGYVLALKSDGAGGYNGVESIAQKVGNMYWPTTLNVLSNATGANALWQVAIPAQKWPYRLCVEGQQTISLDGPDVQVDIMARLGGTGTGTGSTDGQIIARAQGLPGGSATLQNLVLSPAPPVGSAPGFGEVSNGAARTVFGRAEQIGSGTDTFDTVAGRGYYSVRVEPLGA